MLPSTLVDPAIRELLYRYDPGAPLDAEERILGVERGVRVTRFVISSTHGQRVPGLIWTPADRAPGHYPVVILQHGARGRKDEDYIRVPATRWAQRGATCVAIDADEHGERFRGEAQQQAIWQWPWARRDHAVQMCVDLRRTVDYLDARGDVDLSRLGYLGFSMGAINGVAFVSRDPRVTRAAFAIGGANVWRLWPVPEDPAAAEEWKLVAEIVDPVYFAPAITPRPVLLVNGLADEVIPPEYGRELYDALGEPKRMLWFEGGHTGMGGRELREVWAFLGGSS